MTDHDFGKAKSKLILGWQVNLPTRDPKYWMGTDPKPGKQSMDDLVVVPAEHMSSHTAIIAQSGSGKSFFLGRLIEEILVQTKARCIIFDPNADFRKVHEVEDASLWGGAKYDRQKRRGKLPHEASREEFEKHWSRVRRATRIKMGGGGSISGENYEALQIRWASLSIEFLAEEVDPMMRSDLYHCHTFSQDLEILYRLVGYATKKWPENVIFETEKLFRQARLSEGDFRATLEEDFDVDKLIHKLFKSSGASLFKEGSPLTEVLRLFGIPIPRFIHHWPASTIADMNSAYEELLRSRIRSRKERIVKAPKYVSDDVGHFYFSKAREYLIAGILQTELNQRTEKRAPENRLEVIDLPSLRNKATTLLAINTILASEWDRVRREWSKVLDKPSSKDDRAPTFIVVDEAHNLIPDQIRGKADDALREQFRTIVAEGRKYGLFLILVSQRPDKLDPQVLSECENKAVMRLSSGSVLEKTKQLLGLDDLAPKMLEKTLEYETGRVLLIGRWSQDSPQLLYCAARRTIEGGRNLREDHWASPLVVAKQPARSKLSKATVKTSRKTATGSKQTQNRRKSQKIGK